MTDAARLLVRAALDDAFRESVVRDPEAAFADFPNLNDAEKDALRRLDATMLSLLASATHAVPYVPPDPIPPPEPAPPGPVRTALPEMTFVLRVLPTAVIDVEGNVSVEVNVVVQPPGGAPVPVAEEPLPNTAAAVAAIRSAGPDDRYERVLDLARLLRHG